MEQQQQMNNQLFNQNYDPNQILHGLIITQVTASTVQQQMNNQNYDPNQQIQYEPTINQVNVQNEHVYSSYPTQDNPYYNQTSLQQQQ